MGRGRDVPLGTSTARNHSIRRDPRSQISARSSRERYSARSSRTAGNDRDRSFGMASSDRTYGRWQLARWLTSVHRRGLGTYHSSTSLFPFFPFSFSRRIRFVVGPFAIAIVRRSLDTWRITTSAIHTIPNSGWFVLSVRLILGTVPLCSRSSGWHQIVACS